MSIRSVEDLMSMKFSEWVDRQVDESFRPKVTPDERKEYELMFERLREMAKKMNIVIVKHRPSAGERLQHKPEFAFAFAPVRPAEFIPLTFTVLKKRDSDVTAISSSVDPAYIKPSERPTVPSPAPRPKDAPRPTPPLPKQNVCRCDMRAIMWGAPHDDGCPEKKK